MTIETAGTCESCGDLLVVHNRWKEMDADTRANLRLAGYNTKNGHGECRRCARRRLRAAEGAAPRSFYINAEVLSEWDRFVDRRESKARNIEALAPRLGMTVDALEKALQRAGVRAWAS